MKSILAVLLITAFTLVATSSRSSEARTQRPATGDAQTDEPQDKASLWMKHKLVASQKILDGMTRGDFATIETMANSMDVMAYLEGWVRSDMPEYKAQLLAFHHANGEIIRAAQEKNLDGVTLAYTQLTISCVQCHKLVRNHVK